MLRRAEGLGVAPSLRRRALDFGCGAGRLTQALAMRFAQCDGVDISDAMLQTARRHNRHPDRCTYHLNTSPDLALFADASFDFVYSTLVLQHMEPRYSQRSTKPPPADARRTPIPGRLPPDAFHARFTTEPRVVGGGSCRDGVLERGN